MEVLKDHQHGLLPGEQLQLTQQSLQRLLLLALGAEVELGVSVGPRKRKQFGDQGRTSSLDNVGARSAAACRVWLSPSSSRSNSGRTFELHDDGVECAVHVIGRAEVAEARRAARRRVAPAGLR